MADTFSIGNTLSREDLNESFSMVRAALDDALSRPMKDGEEVSITNEEIRKGEEILGTYRVEDDAIRGGMGSVWRVHHQSWDIDLAMKRPQPRFFSEGSERRKEEFIAECEHWINLGLHPNIVSCYYVREIGGVPTIFSEWMDGGSLKDAIRGGTLYGGTEAEVQARILDVAVQTARGLKYSHENGLIHQDVKPGNILLTKKWEAKAADFGLAKAQSRLSDGGAAASTGYTPEYCPKEQAEGAEAEAWMDVYAWALTTAEMYTGKRTWESGAKAAENPEFRTGGNRAEMPEGMEALLKRCLAHGRPDAVESFGAAESALLEIYRKTTGREYPRALFRNGGTSADNLNNYAMSMLDLGQAGVAENVWNEAVERFPDHLQSRINRAFFLWHSAKMTDREVLDVFKTIPDSPEKDAAREIYAAESGEKEDPEEAAASGDIPLAVSGLISDAAYEGNGSIWMATGETLERYDTGTGESVEKITAEKAGTKLILAAASEDGRTVWSGSVKKLLRIDRSDGNSISEIRLSPSGKERAGIYPEKASFINRKHYTFIPDEAKWMQLWTEEKDTVLCILEESLWKDPDDMRKFSQWCMHHTTPVSPNVAQTKRYHVLRYRMDTPESAVLESAVLLTGDRRDLLNYKTTAMEKPGDRWKAVNDRDSLNNPVARLQDTRTGRFVRSEGGEEARILAFSPDRKQYLFAAGKNVIHSKHIACLRRTPEHGAGSRLYTLSRIKDVETVQKEDREAQARKDAFDRAMERKDYPEAIRCFGEYRNLPNRQDTDAALQMEKQLYAVCRRIGVHHVTPAAEVPDGFDTTGPEPEWIEMDVSFLTLDRHRQNRTRDPRYDDAVVRRALETVKAKMPIPYRNDAGEKRTLEGDTVVARLLKKDGSMAYVSVIKLGPGSKEGMVEANLAKGTVRVVAAVAGSPVLAPDGKTLMILCPGDSITIHENSVAGYPLIPDRNRRDSKEEVTFFPDSCFVLYRTRHTQPRERCICGIRPDNPEGNTVCTLLPADPEIPKGQSCKGVRITADGFHLMMLYEEGAFSDKTISVPWLRVSWNYAPPEAGKPGKKVRDEAPEQPKKGLFSRLFGK